MLRQLIQDERGQGVTEYVLILTLVAVVAAVAVALVGVNAKRLYDRMLPSPG